MAYAYDPSDPANMSPDERLAEVATLAYEFARQGRDWEAELRQRAKEVALMTQLGLPMTSPNGSPITVTNQEAQDAQVDPDTTDE